MVPTLPPLPVELPPPPGTLSYILVQSGTLWYALVHSGTLPFLLECTGTESTLVCCTDTVYTAHCVLYCVLGYRYASECITLHQSLLICYTHWVCWLHHAADRTILGSWHSACMWIGFQKSRLLSPKLFRKGGKGNTHKIHEHLHTCDTSVALQNSNFSYWFEFAMYFTLKVQFLAVELKCESENVNWRRFGCSSALLLESEWSHSLEERRPTLGAPSRHWNGDGAIYNRKTWGALPPRLLVDSSPGLTSV